jgi:hypothetical protein
LFSFSRGGEAMVLNCFPGHGDIRIPASAV